MKDFAIYDRESWLQVNLQSMGNTTCHFCLLTYYPLSSELVRSMCAEASEVCFKFIKEYDVSLKVNKDSLTPRKNEAYYSKDMDIHRSLISSALSVFAASGESVFTPLRCLDGIGASGVSGLIWKKYFGDSVDVVINEPSELSYRVIRENVSTNNLQVTVLKTDPCILLHEMPFSFIYLDCHTDACLYLDSLFRNVPKRGIIALTTKDDCALYGRTPEMALRNYGGVIAKTFYSKEFAVRLIIAGMVRSAAKYSKAVHVLCVLSVKSTITIVVKVLKGPAQANSCVDKLQRLIHCNICEDRFFNSSSIYPQEIPSKLLSCNCQAHTPGKIILELGPVWNGSLFDATFIHNMSVHSKNFPWKTQLHEVLRSLMAEAWCPNIKDEKTLMSLLPARKCSKAVSDEKPSEEGEEAPAPPAKRLKEDPPVLPSLVCLKSVPLQEPPFFYNLHRHSPKGPNMAKLEEVVTSLRVAGFRASRTHFDPIAVRTDASLVQLQNLIVHTCNK